MAYGQAVRLTPLGPSFRLIVRITIRIVGRAAPNLSSGWLDADELVRLRSADRGINHLGSPDGRRLHRHGDRRRRPRGDPPHRPRRGADARVHARRHEGDREGGRPGRAARARGADHPRQHVPPALPAGRGDDRGARRPARVHGLGRPDPHRLGRLPGLLAPRHAARASTTTASRSARSTTARPERFTPELAAQIQERLGSDVAMCLDICPPAGVPRAELEEAVRRTTLWAERQRDLPRAPGQLRFAITQGGLDPELRRRSIDGARRRSTSTATRSAASRSGRSAPRCSTPSRRRRRSCPAAKPRYFMGIGDPEGVHRGDRARDRHVRLRPADPHRAAPAAR